VKYATSLTLPSSSVPYCLTIPFPERPFFNLSVVVRFLFQKVFWKNWTTYSVVTSSIVTSHRGEREQFLAILIQESELVDITETVKVCRDSKDDRVLELAVSGGASFIVTGDQDLLVLNPYRGVKILTPSSLLELANEPK
jgi:hypothetical protein